MKLSQKIYYIANARMPTEKAHGIQLAKMCEAFLEQGIDLTLVIPRRKTSDASLKEFYGLRREIPLVTLPVIDLYVHGRPGFFIGSLSYAIGYFFFIAWKRLAGEKIIVYMTDIDQFSFFLIPFLGVPYFCEIHDAKKKSVVFSLLFGCASGIITINTIIKNELSQMFGIVKDHIIVHPNGIDMRMFASLPSRAEARSCLHIPTDKRIVLYVGRFYEWKGLEAVIAASRMIREDVLFYLVGGDTQELVAATGIHDIPDIINCIGNRPFSAIPLWLCAADVLLVLGTKKNKYSYLHTSPMKFFEYMASKRPMIASATPANKEIVSDQDVLFYEPDNARDLAEKIMYAFDHGAEMRQKAEYAFSRADGFSWERRAYDIIQFIETRI